jgi:hypothetical protein
MRSTWIVQALEDSTQRIFILQHFNVKKNQKNNVKKTTAKLNTTLNTELNGAAPSGLPLEGGTNVE